MDQVNFDGLLRLIGKEKALFIIVNRAKKVVFGAIRTCLFPRRVTIIYYYSGVLEDPGPKTLLNYE